ncbi:hypothetical protein D9C73_000099 [Collichthys lucidus]|uniref:Uncharacterized protein n=1 Tax=Collichthys lucidus TaxID=240159 RepID=A0A4U5TWY2_COLLU|nr:hypothetical protein D9C73_000099 [Collichthys lucidus]
MWGLQSDGEMAVGAQASLRRVTTAGAPLRATASLDGKDRNWLAVRRALWRLPRERGAHGTLYGGPGLTTGGNKPPLLTHTPLTSPWLPVFVAGSSN